MNTTKTIYYPGFEKDGIRYHVAMSDYYLTEGECLMSKDYKKAVKKGEPIVIVATAVFNEKGDFVGRVSTPK